MKKEMERQDRERRKEEQRLMREQQKKEERFQREEKREMERRERFMQRELLRVSIKLLINYLNFFMCQSKHQFICPCHVSRLKGRDRKKS